MAGGVFSETKLLAFCPENPLYQMEPGRENGDCLGASCDCTYTIYFKTAHAYNWNLLVLSQIRSLPRHIDPITPSTHLRWYTRTTCSADLPGALFTLGNLLTTHPTNPLMTMRKSMPLSMSHLAQLQIVWKALFNSNSWEITRLLSALTATCILRLQSNEFQKAYRQMYQLDLGANLQILAFIAQEFQSKNNMHKNMRLYRDFLHSQLKGPILKCIKNGLKTEKHRLNILISKRNRDVWNSACISSDLLGVIAFITIMLMERFSMSSCWLKL